MTVIWSTLAAISSKSKNLDTKSYVARWLLLQALFLHHYRKLIALARSISFDIGYKGYKETEKASRIMIDGGWINSRDVFLPGTQYEMAIEFARGKTTNVQMLIEPGSGPFQICLQPDELKIYKFSLRQNTIILDGVSYEYELYADAIKIPEHAIQVFADGRRFFYIIGVQAPARYLNVYAGYFLARATIGQTASWPWLF